MPAARFFIDAPLSPNNRIELPARIAHHAMRVLRLRDGDPIVLFNGTGGEFSASLATDRARAYADIDAFDSVEREAPLSITLVQSWIASEKLDWVVEKAVELGVHSIALAPSKRSVVQFGAERLQKRVTKLQEIVIAACCQSGRNRLPDITAHPTLNAALQAALHAGSRGLLLDPYSDAPMTEAMTGPGSSKSFAVAIGPEGGFDDSEILSALHIGYCRCSLGPRILRTETAGIAALVALQTLAGCRLSNA